MDYLQWTRRASRFLRGLTQLPGTIVVHDSIEPRPSDEGLGATTIGWLKSDQCTLPVPVKAFIATASSRCCFRYRWNHPHLIAENLGDIIPERYQVTGGADLCEAARFFVFDNRDALTGLLGRPRPTHTIEEANRQRGRVCIVPFDSLSRNKDSISLEIKDAEAGGAVVYVRADAPENGHVIANSFDEFLTVWESISYVTPTWENLKPWISPSSGLLEPDDEKAGRLRRMLLTQPLN